MNSIDVVIDDDKKRDTKSSSELVEPPPRLLSEQAEDDVRKLKKDNIVVVESKKEDEDDTGGSVGPRRTLVVYSGPTSMDRLQDKNGMYIDNMNYFIEHGISCFDDAPESRGGGGGDDDDAESVIVNYAFVLTQEVADHYTAPHGLLTNKIQECEGVDKNVRGSDRGGGGGGGGGEQSIRPFIKVITRLDRCYDMESIRIVVKTMNVQALYDNLLFVNCGLVGPKFGPGSPKLIPSSYSSKTKTNNNNNNNNNNAKKKQQQGQGGMMMVPYSHWSQLYTSRLTDSVRLVGHSINTHFHTFFPHVQSFLYALRTDTVPILLSSGAIYDCGLTQEELGGDPEKRFQLINRYEVGMSTQLLKRGYKIATAFVNRYGFGKSLVYDKDSTWGTELDDTVSDIWYEDGIRNLTATMMSNSQTTKFWSSSSAADDGKKTSSAFRGSNEEDDTFEYHQWDILPWDHFVFFKVSRLVPEDVQRVMNYNVDELARSDVRVISNDPRKSPNVYWLKKTGVFVEPRNALRDASEVAVGCIVLFLGLFLFSKEKRRSPLINGGKYVSPYRRIPQLLRRKQVHDHEK